MNYLKYEETIRLANFEREECGMEQLPRMSVSFSGGRTSAVMTKRLWDECKHTHHMPIIFCNTGQEHEATLDFVDRCQNHFGWPIVWLEAVIDPRKNKGVRHRIVSYETACRDGSIFEAAVKKYGIFNQTKKSCTTRLKENVINSYLRSLGWKFGNKRDHKTAIGIRSDEIDRMSDSAMTNYGIIYPMVGWGMTKRDVAIEIKSWPFDLEIPGDHYGNCVWCWKKSKRKHLTLAIENPDVFAVPIYLEETYGHLDGEAGRKNIAEDGRAYFFRQHQSARDIIREAQEVNFRPYTDDPHHHAHDIDDELDIGGACGVSCEPFADSDY